jgi:flagellar export protein FliJ
VKAFRFPLERVLAWRHLQMRAEEEKLSALQHRRDLLNHRVNALKSAELKSKWGLLKLPAVPGSELRAMTAFQDQVKKECTALDLDRAQCEKWIGVQRVRLLKARKDYRVVEKLKEKRQQAWVYLNDREVESAAADSHISKLVRGDQ